uniref:WD_REPEATS_REGION domain-containing protein n=1 Tax=Syphacia muris TaxID=451379 RepID=A0A0N5APC9_9BILA
MLAGVLKCASVAVWDTGDEVAGLNCLIATSKTGFVACWHVSDGTCCRYCFTWRSSVKQIQIHSKDTLRRFVSGNQKSSSGPN